MLIRGEFRPTTTGVGALALNCLLFIQLGWVFGAQSDVNFFELLNFLVIAITLLLCIVCTVLTTVSRNTIMHGIMYYRSTLKA